jgi:type II secretory pathway pseudopilin PulG
MRTSRNRRWNNRHVKKPRGGFSLLEVILATGILMGSAVVLGRLAWMGRTQSTRANSQAEAQRLCEQTLNEILLGLRPADSVELAPLLPNGETAVDLTETTNGLRNPGRFAESASRTGTVSPHDLNQNGQPQWLHSVRVIPHENFPGLAVLTVEVTQSPQAIARPARIRLTRWIRDGSSDGGETQENREPLELLTGGLSP